MPLARQIAVPTWHDHDQVARPVGNALASQPRSVRQPIRRVQLIFLLLAGPAAGFKPFPDDHVTGRAAADPAAGVIDLDPVPQGDLEQAAGPSVIVVRQFRRIDFDDVFPPRLVDIGDRVLLRGQPCLGLIDIRIATHEEPFQTAT